MLYDDEWRDEEFMRRAKWAKAMSILPRQCSKTKEFIWPLSNAMQGVAVWNGPGMPVYEKHWITERGYIMLKLKGKI